MYKRISATPCVYPHTYDNNTEYTRRGKTVQSFVPFPLTDPIDRFNPVSKSPDVYPVQTIYLYIYRYPFSPFPYKVFVPCGERRYARATCRIISGDVFAFLPPAPPPKKFAIKGVRD